MPKNSISKQSTLWGSLRLESISEVGIQVPITVFEERNKYILIDGERRWKCARKLNLLFMPAIIQPKPSKLENLLTMFNIHNVRVQWDPLPMAYKLKEVKNLLDKQRKPSAPKNLAAITGLLQSTVRRAFDLLELPDRYQKLLLKEAEKPKDEQEITADLFIEIFKSRRVVESHLPGVFKAITKKQYVESMFKKYREGVVKNIVRFRDISKIARGENIGFEKKKAQTIVTRLVSDLEYRVEDAYMESVELAYGYRDLTTRTASLIDRLKKYKVGNILPQDLLSNLKQLRELINNLLKDI